jgi:ubiquitin-protein ligase
MEEISNIDYIINKISQWSKGNQNYLSIESSDKLDDSTFKFNLKTSDNNYVIFYTNNDSSYYFVEPDNNKKSVRNLQAAIISINYVLFDSEDLNLDKVLNTIKKYLSKEDSSEDENEDEVVDNYNVGLNTAGNADFLKKKEWQDADYQLRKKSCNIDYFNIPRNLIYSPDIIFNIVSNELIKLQRLKQNKFKIDVTDSNIYNLKLKLNFDEKSDLGSQLEELSNKYGYNYIELKLNLNMNLYPFFPPSLELIKPKINNDTLYGIMDLEFLKLENWNPTNSIEFVIHALYQIFEKYAVIEVNCPLNGSETAYLPLEYSLIKLSTKYKLNAQTTSEIDVEYTKLSNSTTEEKKTEANKYWKGGVGYGHSNRKEWDINAYIRDQERVDKEISLEIQEIAQQIESFDTSGYNTKLEDIVQPSCLFTLVRNRMRGTTLMEIDKNNNIYSSLIDVISIITTKNLWKIDNIFRQIYESINTISLECQAVIDMAKKTSANIDPLYEKIIQTNLMLQGICSSLEQENHDDELLDLEGTYMKAMQPLQFGSMNIIGDSSVEYKFRNSGNITNYGPKNIMRIVKEMSTLSSSLPLSLSSTVFIKTDANNVNSIKFMIMGPKDTPYESGCFEFDAHFTSDYPNSPPKVLLLTTGGGSVRFNPNLYNCGKVCLSLLGTWSGQKGESWNKDTSTFLQVIVSIQSLIMVDEPYFNEPGWEREMHTETGKKKSFDYNDKVRLNNLKWAIVNQLKKPSKGFEDIIMRHFYYKKDNIIKLLEKWSLESKNTEFNKYFDEAKELLNNLKI